MVKVVFQDLKRLHRAAPASVGRKRVATESGVKVVRTLDAHSPTFEDDFSYVFGQNVAKARKENKRVLGVADLLPAKR